MLGGRQKHFICDPYPVVNGKNTYAEQYVVRNVRMTILF